MEIFRNLRLGNGRAILQRRMSKNKRVVQYTNFVNVRTIGIVWDASNLSEFASLNRFHQKMQDAHIDVRIFGYFSGKILPDQYTALRYLVCIRKDELSRFYLPESKEATDFINTPFDVLIDINLTKELALTYVTSLSKAKIRIGLFEKGSAKQPYEIMLELNPPIDIDNYLAEVIKYLEMIKTYPETAH
jgi:hypothetical protein